MQINNRNDRNLADAIPIVQLSDIIPAFNKNNVAKYNIVVVGVYFSP